MLSPWLLSCLPHQGVGGQPLLVSPTVFTKRGYRFFFFSREEARMHVHVRSTGGEAKYWLEPEVELAKNWRYSQKQLQQIQSIVEAHRDELTAAWRNHFRDRSN